MRNDMPDVDSILEDIIYRPDCAQFGAPISVDPRYLVRISLEDGASVVGGQNPAPPQGE